MNLAIIKPVALKPIAYYLLLTTYYLLPTTYYQLGYMISLSLIAPYSCSLLLWVEFNW